MKHAFADESIRGNDYLICATTVATSDLREARKALRGLCLSNQRRIHFVDESNVRRRKVLTALADIGVSSHVFVGTSRDQGVVRHAILQEVVRTLRSLGVTRLVLDCREGQDQRDRAAIRDAIGGNPEPPFEHTHLKSATEPMLWAPDAVAWAWGRGGEWRRQTEGLGLVDSVTSVELSQTRKTRPLPVRGGAGPASSG